VSKCGYGLLYKVALYEIIMRSLIGWNTDYSERFGMPTTIIKTVKDDEEERGKAEEAAQKLGSSGYMILDINDEFEFAETKGGQGTGWQTYDNLEGRCKKTISFLILGHEDAASSQPGKMGGQQGAKNLDQDASPIGQALAACESKDARFEENIVNNHLIPKLIKLGIPLPLGKKYKLKNDKERELQSTKETKKALDWATVAYTMSQAGLEMDEKQFADKSGVTASKVIEPPAPSFSGGMKEKLAKLYK
jgi:hypothetical protein